jgi:hypothetical protein
MFQKLVRVYSALEMSAEKKALEATKNNRFWNCLL